MINKFLNKVIKSICNIDVNLLIADLSTKKQEVYSLKGQLTRSKNANDSKSAQIVQLESEIDNQKDEINTLQSLNVELSSMLEFKRTEIVSLQHERNNLSSDIANKLQTINEQNLRNTALQEELDQTKSALQNSNQEYTTQMRNKCSELEQNIQRISDEKDALASNIAELQSQIADKNSEIERLKEKDNQTSATNEELLRNQTHLHEELSTIRAEKDALLQQHEEEIIRNKQQIEEHKQTIESLLSEKVALITQVGTLQNSIADYESKIKTLEEENNQLTVSNEELSHNHALLQEENPTIRAEKENPLQQVEQEQPKETGDVSQTIKQMPTEDKSLEIEHQDSSENKNDITEIKQDNLATNSILSETDSHEDTMTSKDPVADSDENLDNHGQVVPGESSLHSSSEIIYKDIDDAFTNSTENKTEGEQNETLTDLAMMNETEVSEDELDDDSLTYFYDDNLVPADKLSIPEVYDVKEEKTINSRDFFRQNENELILWRRNLQEEYLMGHARFICPECKQPVKISGHKLARGRVCYFAHFKDSDDCSYKTGTHRSKEEVERLKYSLVQESDRHKRLKAAIASALKGEQSKSKGVENVECEKRINSDIPYLNWRRPDIYAEYNGRKYVFELQLSTTFVSVVVDRDIFYRLNDYNIIWIFNFEDNAEYVNLHNLMCKDIYYANKRNVFIFDSDAEERSKEKGELVLKCRWLDENGQWSSDQYVTLDMLQYDEENCKPFIVDADKAYLEKYPEYLVRRKQLEHSREYLLKALMERQKREEELEEKKIEERSNLQMEILNDNKSVMRFRSGTKYGYQYEGTTILPAKYTSAEDFHDNQYAQVGFNRKIGLVRRDGKEVIPIKYKNIQIINERYGILLAIYKCVDLWFNDLKFELMDEYNEKEQKIMNENKGNTKLFFCRSNIYSYYYTRSYYGDYPIRHKSSDGYDDSILFAFQEEMDYCILWVYGKVFMMSKNGDFFIKGQYSDIKPIGREQVFIVKDYNTKLWGVIDLQGHVIDDFKYSLLVPTNSEYLIAKYENTPALFGLIDYLGREYFAPKFKGLFYLSSEYFAFKEYGLWGICDRFGEIIHRAKYTYIKSEMSGSLRASTLNFHKNKWEIDDYSPRYFDENEKLCLLDENGKISYTEQIRGNYIVRHSGDLYSIYSLSNDQLADYCLLSVSFVTDALAIIENIEGKHGFYYDDRCHYVDNCIRISHLFNDIYTFEDKSNQIAIGNHLGPISEYLYNSISIIDSSLFKASKVYKYDNWSSKKYYRYYIINELGEVLSEEFSFIGIFQNGIAEATYKNRKGIINSQGEMQEKIVASYGEYSVCEKFEHLYFKNSANEIVSEECQSIEPLCQSYFSIKSCSNNHVRIFSLEECLPSDKYFESVKLLKDKLFVVRDLLEYKNPYRLYKGISPFINESFSVVKLLENGYIAFQKRIDSSYTVKYIWKIVNTEGDCLTNREIDSITTVTSDSFEVVIEGNNGKIDLNGNDIIEKSEFHEDLILNKCFGYYGLEDKKGNILLSLDQKFTDIVLLNNSYLKVCKDSMYALFSISGKRITNYKYTDISIHEDGDMYAMRNNHIGRLDTDGKEIPELEAFDGGYLQSCFGEYSILDESKEEIIFAGYSKIELLDNEGVFALWKDNMISLGNKHKEKTESHYQSVKAIGNGLFIVSKTITRNKRVRNTGYSHWGNSYTYYTSQRVLEEKFGVIDKNLQTIVPCKYKSISGFDSNNQLEVKENNGTSKIFSLKTLNQKSIDIVDLTSEVGYQAEVKGFMPIGLIVKIKDSTYIVHKKYLYKSKSEFKKGEIFIVKYLSNDNDGHPVWETNSCAQEPVEELTENKN